MSELLNRAAVGCLNSKEAKELLQEYLKTTPEMAFSHTDPANVQQQPQGTGAGDKLTQLR